MAKYINVDELIKKLEISARCIDCKYCHGDEACHWYEDDMVWVCAQITEFPAADVRENRHGRWEKESDYLVMGEGYIWFCSECGFTMYFDKNGIHNNFCPNCGARMER